MTEYKSLTPISMLNDSSCRTNHIIVLTAGKSVIRRNDIRGFFSALDLSGFKGIDGFFIDGSVPELIREIAEDACSCRNIPILESIPSVYLSGMKAA